MKIPAIGERSDAVLRTAIGERSDAVLRTAMGERSDAVLRTAMGERSDAVLRTVMSDRKPTTPRRARPEDAPSIRALPSKFLALAGMIAAWFFITRQPPQVSAEILRVLLLMAMGAMGAKLVSELITDLCGKPGLEMLETAGRWIAAVFASLVHLLLIASVLAVISYCTGLTMLDLLRHFGLNV